MPAVTTGQPPRPAKHPAKGKSGIRRGRVAAAAAAVIVVAGVVIGLLLSGGGGPAKPPPRPGTTVPKLAVSRCPLTDVPAPGGKVPQRPAVAVKVGNEPQGARPQSGLGQADIVYDTPAEGFIMRYVAVYQCGSASMVGPNRSVRWVDWHILQAFGTPILAFAGGIDPDVHTVEGLDWLRPANLLGNAASAGIRTTNRVPPDNLYTSTAKLLALYPHDTTPPQPVFAYSPSPSRSATPAAKLAINFSPGTDVVWIWDAAAGEWEHTYGGQPDIDALTNRPVMATNVVVQIVHYTFGPYEESPGSTGDVESQVIGTGAGYVLRNGKVVKVTWHRAAGASATTFTDAHGRPVDLAPGRTWVELLLNTTAATPGALTITP